MGRFRGRIFPDHSCCKVRIIGGEAKKVVIVVAIMDAGEKDKFSVFNAQCSISRFVMNDEHALEI